MAAISLAKPGSKWGPCRKNCEHRDCAATRKMAESNCTICDKAIGYGTRLYSDPDSDDRNQMVHAVCLEAKYERR